MSFDKPRPRTNRTTKQQENLRALIERRTETLGQIGSGQVSAFESVDSALRVGHARRRVRDSLVNLEGQLSSLNALVDGRTSNQDTRKAEHQLRRLRGMVASGDLPPEVLEHHQLQYARTRAVDGVDDPLQRLINLLRTTSPTRVITGQELGDLVGKSDKTVRGLMTAAEEMFAAEGFSIENKVGRNGGFYLDPLSNKGEANG